MHHNPSSPSTATHLPQTPHFEGPDLPAGFTWLNPPARFELGQGLVICPPKETDLWQRTHYGFRRDDAPCLVTRLSGDFSITTVVESKPRDQYDQCGLIVRADSENWIKLSTEFEDARHSRLGSVVTNMGYSDWATQDIPTPAANQIMWYWISRRGDDFLLEHSWDGRTWQQLRIAHLHRCGESLEAGVYACSPVGENFWCRFLRLDIGPNGWDPP